MNIKFKRICFINERDESKYGHISNWDTSEVTDMKFLFENAKDFNDNIGRWDTLLDMSRNFGEESFKLGIGTLV